MGTRHNSTHRQPLSAEGAILIGALVAIGLIGLLNAGYLLGTDAPALTPSPATSVSDQDSLRPTATASATPTLPPTATSTPSRTRTPSVTPTPTLTPTPSPDLAGCNVAGCGPAAVPLPTLIYDTDLLLRQEPLERRLCPECPQNDHLGSAELDRLLTTSPATLAQLRQLVLSQEPYQIAPGIVYLAFDYVHHVVVDLKESGFVLRNIIPPIGDPELQESIRITPAYCLRPESLVVTNADYHGLVGSNKTEQGRELFFHLGRAALFQREGRYDIDVIREHPDFARTSVSWGGGPIFIWNGLYDYNPEQEWFTPENLAHYRDTRWAKLTVALSQNRRYLFISASYNLTLQEHAENIIELGRRWGIEVDRAMRFDGSESAFLAIRLGETMVPVLALPEPLIVNCLAIERNP